MRTEHQFTRRDLIKVAGAAAIGLPTTTLVAGAATSASDQTRNQQSNTRTFPKGFFWGVGTQKRTPKLSASFYRETIKRNAVA